MVIFHSYVKLPEGNWAIVHGYAKLPEAAWGAVKVTLMAATGISISISWDMGPRKLSGTALPLQVHIYI